MPSLQYDAYFFEIWLCLSDTMLVAAFHIFDISQNANAHKIQGLCIAVEYSTANNIRHSEHHYNPDVNANVRDARGPSTTSHDSSDACHDHVKRLGRILQSFTRWIGDCRMPLCSPCMLMVTEYD